MHFTKLYAYPFRLKNYMINNVSIYQKIQSKTIYFKLSVKDLNASIKVITCTRKF